MTSEQEYKSSKKALFKNSLPTGTVINGKYEVVQPLGAGGFGIVYKVKDIPFTSYFALKEFFQKGCYREGTNTEVRFASTMENEVKRGMEDFVKEAKRLKELSGTSRNIVNVKSVFRANNTAYYVMEYLAGDNLDTYVRKNGSLNERKAISIIAPIAGAVGMLHKENLLHLDVKPENIVLRNNKDIGSVSPVLIDFGTAKHFNKHGRPTTLLHAKGFTNGYCPIEQKNEIRKFAPEIDVYALGATLYFLLTGKNPPPAEDLSVAEIRKDLVKFSEQTRQCVLNAMKKANIERTPTTNVFLRDILGNSPLPVSRRVHNYIITDVVEESDVSITYKAIYRKDISKTQIVYPNPFLIHELFLQGSYRRKDDGTVDNPDARKLVHIFASSPQKMQEAIRSGYTTPPYAEFGNKYHAFGTRTTELDERGLVVREKFFANSTFYVAEQIIPKPSWWKQAGKKISIAVARKNDTGIMPVKQTSKETSILPQKQISKATSKETVLLSSKKKAKQDGEQSDERWFDRYIDTSEIPAIILITLMLVIPMCFFYWIWTRPSDISKEYPSRNYVIPEELRIKIEKKSDSLIRDVLNLPDDPPIILVQPEKSEKQNTSNRGEKILNDINKIEEKKNSQELSQKNNSAENALQKAERYYERKQWDKALFYAEKAKSLGSGNQERLNQIIEQSKKWNPPSYSE